MTPPLKKSDLFEDDCLRGRAFTSAWTDRVDDWLRELYREAATGARPMALVAVGGQGRREMAPQSDLDLLLLFEGARHRARPPKDCGTRSGARA
ncbi:MAG: DUF294 nucleotidyltransferase-like domain-containing protein [Microthrixaceae bacterium]